MKKLYFLFVLLALAACQKEETVVKNDWSADALSGRVASYRIVNYLAALDLGEIYPSDVIGAEGRIVYNEQGFRTEEFWRFNDATSRKEYRYDDKNNCVELLTFTPENAIDERGVFVYDNAGVLQEEIYYNANNEQVAKLQYAFDDAGNLVEYFEYAPDGTLESSQKSSYDDGLEIERYTYYYEGGNTMVTKLENVYDKARNLTEGVLYDDAKNVLGRWIYTYDEHRNLLSEECYDAENLLAEKRTYTYKYDEQDNWVERITFDGADNEPRVITQRQFEYFQ